MLIKCLVKVRLSRDIHLLHTSGVSNLMRNFNGLDIQHLGDSFLGFSEDR